MFRWIPFPFLRYLMVFAGGIITGIYTGYHPSWMAFAGIAVGYGIIIFWPGMPQGSKQGIMAGILALIALYFAGMIHVNNYDDANKALHLVNQESLPPFYQAQVVEPSENTGKYYKTVVEVTAALWPDTVVEKKRQALRGKVILYHPMADDKEGFAYGDRLVVKGKPRRVEGPSNPGAFNYKQFLAYRNIFHQHFAEVEDLVLSSTASGFSIMGLAYEIRSKCRNILNQYIHDKEALSIALALTLGIKSEMDRTLENAFAAAGAMHILAVSGLHVGIIYGIIYLLLYPMKKWKGGAWLHGGLSILLLWGYAMITGLSPSVLRAVTMFSFVIVASMVGRQQGIFNTIALSAFVLLCFNPFLLLHVGFQLSYMAVFGIVLLYPYIKNWFHAGNIPCNKIWQITAVSIAAQIATFPLALFYFHQFPVYFIFTNLLVIPAASVILSLGMGTLVLGFVFSWLAEWTGWLLEKGIQGLIRVVYFQETLPMNTLSNLEITFWQVILLYLFTAIILLLFVTRNFYWMVLGVCCLFFITGKEVYDIYKAKNQEKMVVYNLPGNSVTGFISGTKYHLKTSSAKSLDKNAFAFHIEPSLIQWSLDEKKSIKDLPVNQEVSKEFKVLDFHGRQVILITEKLGDNFALEQPLVCDYLVISNNAVHNFNLIAHNFKSRQIIIDSSNEFYRARELSSKAEDYNVSCHNILEQGAFVVNL